MGWLCSGLTFPLGCLILVWAAGSGSVKVLRTPTCFSDYVSTATCEWKMDHPTNCNTTLLLFYKQEFDPFENHTCVPKNKEDAVCVCSMLLGITFYDDTYTLSLWAGQQLQWTDTFQPSQHVKPRTPTNLTVHKNNSEVLLLTWNNPYDPHHFLYSGLIYLVNISNENDPWDFTVQQVTYSRPFLRLPANSLKADVSYKARVRAQSPEYNSSWSEWSHSRTWYNTYKEPLEQRVTLGVSISCVVILAVCLSFYFIIIKIKKEWWDHIPNPAHSPLITIIIQESQVPLWGKQSRNQKLTPCPRWKTCLTKLLPCLLEHGKEKEEDPLKATKQGPVQGSGKSAWCPVELSKMVLLPETVSMVRSLELFEAPVEEEEEEEDKGSFCPSPESSGGSCQDGREGIVARLTESLFLDLLGGQDGDCSPPGLGEPLPSPLSESSTQTPWVEVPSTGPREVVVQGKDPELASLALTKTPTLITDNPAYRSLSQSPGLGKLDRGPELTQHLGEADSQIPGAPQPSEQPELETWEQILRQSVLQQGAAPAPVPAQASGYRDFVSAVRTSSTQPGWPVSPPGEVGYKAFSSLLTSNAICPGGPGVEATSEEGSYKPFQNLLPGCPEASGSIILPHFTFGLDIEPSLSPLSSHLPSRSPEHLSLGLVEKGGDSQKPPLSPEQAADLLRGDLGSGIVYSTLTCHLCGHLKQCHGQEERGKVPAVSSPCCGCCCGDGSEPPGNPASEGLHLEASPSPAPPTQERKSSLSSQPDLSNSLSSGQPPKMVAVAPTEPHCIWRPKLWAELNAGRGEFSSACALLDQMYAAKELLSVPDPRQEYFQQTPEAGVPGAFSPHQRTPRSYRVFCAGER
ncbi:PREDICTED: interleukin-4 receptor subunit alpha [Chrysochloris asiatica]|uniref:Interleukin-4 receptor subunit alpha n=1 Tax=Chrysochloris asiatica TaxID=185453 RepID=A0A9B0T6K4_CHRAS|nr:PREDICTED: interleukin-4 receptor subunit alpha [Chrysochloris asiatica]